MNSRATLPPSGYNLPPGISTADIDGPQMSVDEKFENELEIGEIKHDIAAEEP